MTTLIAWDLSQLLNISWKQGVRYTMLVGLLYMLIIVLATLIAFGILALVTK